MHLLNLSTAELVNAVGRMPEPADLQYLGDAQFVSHSTQGGGLSQLLLALAMALLVAVYLGLRNWQTPRRAAPLSRAWLLLPLSLFAVHSVCQQLKPSEADQWLQFNLPHKLLAESTSSGQQYLADWLDGNEPGSPPDISALNQLDLNGTPLLVGRQCAQRTDHYPGRRDRGLSASQPSGHRQQLHGTADATPEPMGRARHAYL